MRLASLALLGLAACRHAPPDKEARAAVPPAAARVPEASEILGAWRCVALRGAPAELGHTVLYVFAANGTYTGALVSESECMPIGGPWEFEGGRLSLDGGSVVLETAFVDDRLTLSAGDTYAELVRLGAFPGQPIRSTPSAPPR